MLEDKLLEASALQHHRIFVKGANFPGKLHAIEKVHGHVLVAVQSGIEERLRILPGNMCSTLIRLAPGQPPITSIR